MALSPPGGPTTLNLTGIKTNGDESVESRTPANEPNQSGAWGSITIRYQIDVPFKDSSVEINATNLGTAAGHFARVDSGLTTDVETHQATTANITSAGLHLIECVATWVATGSQTDRASILVASIKVFGHGNDSWGLDVDEADDFFDGGWPAASLDAPAVAASAAAVANAAAAALIKTLSPQQDFDAEVALSHSVDAEVALSHNADAEVALSHDLSVEA